MSVRHKAWTGSLIVTVSSAAAGGASTRGQPYWTQRGDCKHARAHRDYKWALLWLSGSMLGPCRFHHGATWVMRQTLSLSRLVLLQRVVLLLH